MSERLSDFQLLSLAKKAVRGKLFNVQGDLRQDLVDLVDRVINDNDTSTLLQLKAGQLLLLMEQLNISSDRLQIDGGGERSQATVVVLLPENLTEVKTHDSERDQDVMDDADGDGCGRDSGLESGVATD